MGQMLFTGGLMEAFPMIVWVCQCGLSLLTRLQLKLWMQLKLLAVKFTLNLITR